MKISENFSHNPNFINYPHREEMVSDGIENCLMYFENFDPEKSKNPFAYFTQIIFFAFVRRILKEKKQTDTKHRFIQQMDITQMVTQEHDNGDFQNQFLDYLKTQLDTSDYEKIATYTTETTQKILNSMENASDN